MLMEMTVLCFCLLATVLRLRSIFLKLLNSRQEVRAKEYLFMIKRNMSFLIRVFADYASISLIFIAPIANAVLIMFHNIYNEDYFHCPKLSINDCQLYIQYTVVCLSSLAILDCLIVSCTVGRLTKTVYLVTLFGCYALSIFGLLFFLSFCASKDEAVISVCIRSDNPMAMLNTLVEKYNMFFRRFVSVLYFSSICALAHAAHRFLIRLASEMAVSIFKDSKREGVDKDKSDVLAPSTVTWIHTELAKESTMTTGLFCDDEDIRMWREYFLSSKAEMSVPSVWESLRRFTYGRERLNLGLIIYVIFITGVYYYTEYLSSNTNLKDVACLIFTTLLTFNNIARVIMVAAIDGINKEATCREF